MLLNFANFLAVLSILASLTSGIFTHLFIKKWERGGLVLPNGLKKRQTGAGRTIAPILPSATLFALFLGGLWWFLHADEVRLYSHSGVVQCLAFAPDGNSFAAGGSEAFVRIWDTESGKELGRLRGETIPIQYPINQIAFSSDGKFLAASAESYVWIWDPSQGKEVWAFRTKASISFVDGLSFLPGNSNHQLLIAWIDGLELVDAEKRTRIDFPKTGRTKSGLAVSRDGRYAITSGSLEEDFELWDLLNRQVVGRSGPDLQKEGTFEENGVNRILNQSLGEHVMCLALGRGLRYMLTANHWSVNDNSNSQVNDILIWDVEHWKVLRRFHAHEGAINTLAVSADDRFVLSGSKDGTVALWDFDAGNCLNRYRGHQDAFGVRPSDVTAVAFHPKKSLALSAGRDRTVRLWRLPD